MKLEVTDNALNWFNDEMDAEKGDTFRFFVRYGGNSPVQSGFSLGVTKETAQDVATSLDKDGITFFIENKDLWFFDQHDLKVDIDQGDGTLSFYYSK
ncbi:HesB/YadR/YfhF family protein [Fictibacillus barbaricus]|uniref:HesB/YadR/YfhF family protein n=1 Tax=Fictibacillus barbaricus TaxID=182136 RepID=A0ABS2Z7U6_9BACL|nr:HesB/YadR/YfhF family protein [Fictibacillus barbaricus]MBN3544143.1 HesB/YadR/YfhF family protein [Fictibacillus barbaricus]GGB69277.1 hypothetical protein GCM10007199_39360 [Fictibacillus barbaricus]